MQFVILGTGPGIPQLDKHLSSLYVKTEELAILIDCGEGVSREILRRGLSGDHLDIIVITHYHPDHVSGLFMLMQMLYLEHRTKPLELYLPECPEFIENALRQMYTFKEKFKFPLSIRLIDELHRVHPGFDAMISDHLWGYRPQIESLGLSNQMKSWSIKVSENERSLLYSSDLSSVDSIAALLPGTHTMIVDALHPSAAQILSLENLGMKRILLTHGVSEDLARELSSRTNGGNLVLSDKNIFIYATEGESYEV
ncbi:MAG TPA: MBL fold metallo-hydrolase [Candidatus Cloacimonadota bacterium]|nr:MBL fold metallo-hydrolase [Candidatus Cloacimonadota bacterium]